MFPKVLQKINHKTGHLWLAIGGSIMFVIALALATCALMGLSVTKLVLMIEWEHVGSIAVILSMILGGNGLIFVAFMKNPDEVRRQMLDEQQHAHAEELKRARRKSYDEGFAAGQKVGIEAGVAKATTESSTAPKPIKPTVVTEPSATTASPPATLVATDVIPPPTHTGRPVVVAAAGVANAN